MSEFGRTSPEAFARPETVPGVITAPGHGGQHQEILQNFTDAILDGAPLIAPAAEGIHSVELANAMLLSGWIGQTVELPLDAAHYERRLQQRIRESRFKKKAAVSVAATDFAKSFGR